jgi:hypothetical protein
MNRYRVQKREWSADVVEKNISSDPKKPIWKVYIAPISHRHDIVAGVICEFLNEKL